MNITIMNSTFGLSYDDATDVSGQWQWTDKTPLCPKCIRRGSINALLTHGKENTKLVSVVSDKPDEIRVICESCGWKSEPIQ